MKDIELVIDLEDATVATTAWHDLGLSIAVDSPAVDIGVPGLTGEKGEPGPVGMVKVTHGADPNVPRPDVPVVYWVGTVQPLNADPDDFLLIKET